MITWTYWAFSVGAPQLAAKISWQEASLAEEGEKESNHWKQMLGVTIVVELSESF